MNVSDKDAKVTITAYFSDREPADPYRPTVPTCGTLYVRFKDVTDLEAIPLDTDCASVIESDVPVVVQHTRLDWRRAKNDEEAGTAPYG